jgi:hypothetical protein
MAKQLYKPKKAKPRSGLYPATGEEVFMVSLSNP